MSKTPADFIKQCFWLRLWQVCQEKYFGPPGSPSAQAPGAAVNSASCALDGAKTQLTRTPAEAPRPDLCSVGCGHPGSRPERSAWNCRLRDILHCRPRPRALAARAFSPPFSAFDSTELGPASAPASGGWARWGLRLTRWPSNSLLQEPATPMASRQAESERARS